MFVFYFRWKTLAFFEFRQEERQPWPCNVMCAHANLCQPIHSLSLPLFLQKQLDFALVIHMPLTFWWRFICSFSQSQSHFSYFPTTSQPASHWNSIHFVEINFRWRNGKCVCVCCSVYQIICYTCKITQHTRTQLNEPREPNELFEKFSKPKKMMMVLCVLFLRHMHTNWMEWWRTYTQTNKKSHGYYLYTCLYWRDSILTKLQWRNFNRIHFHVV